MSDEPTNAELGRRLDDISRGLRDLIGEREYSEYQRAINGRLEGLARELDDARRIHAEDVEKLHTRISGEVKAAVTRSQFRQSLTATLIPSLIAVAAILVTIWMHGRG